MGLADIPTDSLMGKMLRFPLRFVPDEMRILRGKSRGKKWIVRSASHSLWLGIFEPEERSVFESTVPNGGILFDIGANVGFYALLASVLVGDGKVFAFEPLPHNLLYLKTHLRLNRITNVTVIEAAVSEHGGTAKFEEGANPSTSHISARGEIEVRVVALDELISRGELPPPDYMKIDVEGAEFSVLGGAAATLREHQPAILLATHGREVHERCCRFLSALEYRIEPLLDNGKAGDKMRGEVLAHPVLAHPRSGVNTQ